ncbi:uncharacterized protein C11orf24 homolog [Aplysia californica]|uniref:Uncharacterized protein C11orf24 homolog n=1 Tax=Aplysia californica TaxID=6500 RepID=A0ABM1A6T9_APLCA|nr:uncharacterized protein C11orf24 homolog [Aplysia californica]XP_012941955.1 uncharacterized protein C11orf24 homolog [Aplysia californica]
MTFSQPTTALLSLVLGVTSLSTLVQCASDCMLPVADPTSMFSQKNLTTPTVSELEVDGVTGCTDICCQDELCNVLVYNQAAATGVANCLMYACRPLETCNLQSGQDLLIFVDKSFTDTPTSTTSETSGSQTGEEEQTTSPSAPSSPKNEEIAPVVVNIPLENVNNADKETANAEGLSENTENGDGNVGSTSQNTEGTPEDTLEEDETGPQNDKSENSETDPPEVQSPSTENPGGPSTNGTENSSGEAGNEIITPESAESESIQEDSNGSQSTPPSSEVPATPTATPSTTTAPDSSAAVTPVQPPPASQPPNTTQEEQEVENIPDDNTQINTTATITIVPTTTLSGSETASTAALLPTPESLSNDVTIVAPTATSHISLSAILNSTGVLMPVALDSTVLEQESIAIKPSEQSFIPSPTSTTEGMATAAVTDLATPSTPTLENPTPTTVASSSSAQNISPTPNEIVSSADESLQTTPPIEMTTTQSLTDVTFPGYANERKQSTASKEGVSNVMTAVLVSSLTFGCVFVLTVVAVLGKRIYDSYRKRHYSRLDYLINGMYN